MEKQKKGISLIVLVITIIVMIILATAVIITLSSTNIITKAREAVLKTDVKNFEQELSISLADKKLADSSLSFTDVNATTLDEIKEYIPDFNKKYEGKIFILNGELVYDASVVTSDEKEALEAMGVTAGKIYTPAEIKAIIESKNLGEDISTADITEYIEGLSKKEAEKYTIFRGDLYYRYEKTTYEEQLEIYAAGISILMGDANGDGLLTSVDYDLASLYESFTLEFEFTKNMVYISNFDFDEIISTAEAECISGILNGDKILDVVSIEQQNPARIKLIGDYVWFYWDVYHLTEQDEHPIPGDLNTTEYAEMRRYDSSMTEEQAKKFQIVNGAWAYKESALTQEEKAWLDEVNIPYL